MVSNIPTFRSVLRYRIGITNLTGQLPLPLSCTRICRDCNITPSTTGDPIVIDDYRCRTDLIAPISSTLAITTLNKLVPDRPSESSGRHWVSEQP